MTSSDEIQMQSQVSPEKLRPHRSFPNTTRFKFGHFLILPCGSASLASMRASEVAMSVFAGVTARMRHVSRSMYDLIISVICCWMSLGWSPTGILARPGKSIRVMLRTKNVVRARF